MATIDLTGDSPVASLPSAESTQPDEEEEEEPEEEEPSLLLGSFQCQIVGIRYYDGVAHPGEYVKLLREPRNPYDRNAIRVDNMANIKVGHIKKTVAAALAPIMDEMEHVKIDGTIPSRGNAYTLPCRIELFGKSREDMERVNVVLKRFRQYWQMNPTLNPPSEQTAKKRSPKQVEVATKTVDWRSAQKTLDDMFEKMSKEQLSDLPDIAVPDMLTTTLLDHQVEGIRWLYKRETADTEAPFYKQIKEKGKQVWFSEITNSTQQMAPLPVKGSILCDDMGLGKTLQAIGLILANPLPPDSPGKKTTLIISPVSVMPNWLHQIEQHVAESTLKVALYHGPDRHELLEDDSIDIIISSYGTISYDHGKHFPKQTGKENDSKPPAKKKKKQRKGDTIFSHNWHRVILDESHTIRNTKSRTFAACTTLKSTYRLCLTGTPLQNKPEDIQALFSFLGVPDLGDKSIFRRAVSQPIQNGDEVGLSRLRTMMAHVALRRNKSKLDLVEKTVELRSIVFPEDSPHKRIHDALFESARLAFCATLSAGDDRALSNYMQILETLLRIRQSCLHGDLVPKDRLEAAEKVLAEVKGKKGQLTAEEGEKLLMKLKGAFSEDAEAVECAICLSEMEESEAVILRTCSHVFCEPCLSQVSSQCRGLCPFCRCKFEPHDMVKKSAAAAATETDGEPVKSLVESLGDLDPSPKLEALKQAIAEMKSDEKGVVFSSFTQFLDIIQSFLKSQGHTFCRLDGKMSAKKRIASMKEFNAEGGPRFMLASLHAAGTGITLNRANHCFLVDVWWNKSAEEQAMDRVHRIGQTRPVRVVRFVMKDTIEDRMVELQESKAAIGKGAMQKLKPEEIRRARIGDLKSLFSIKGSSELDTL